MKPIWNVKLSEMRIILLGLMSFIIVMTASLLVKNASSQVIKSSPKAIAPNAVYMQPVQGLSHVELQKFKAGEKQFRAPWVVFPLLGGEWGLGPTFLANSCSNGHFLGYNVLDRAIIYRID